MIDSTPNSLLGSTGQLLPCSTVYSRLGHRRGLRTATLPTERVFFFRILTLARKILEPDYFIGLYLGAKGGIIMTLNTIVIIR